MPEFNPSKDDIAWLHSAAELAIRGAGCVEPNPMVGCIVVRGDVPIGMGWHQAFGGPHAEVHALSDASGDLSESTVYVTLEPCCHQGKTAACTDLLISRRPKRVVVGCIDPNPIVAGKGIKVLREAGIQVDLVTSVPEMRELIRPFAKLMLSKRPWIIGKWAASLDGKTATADGESQWITGEAARADVHRTRGRVDAIMTGVETVLADNPLLTARPAGPRVAVRVVCDSHCRTPADSQLALTAKEIPVLVACGTEHDLENRRKLEELGVEVLVDPADTHAERLRGLVKELGQRQFTNVLVESGGTLLGALEEIGELDEVHSYVAPSILGGEPVFVPVQNAGRRGLAQKTRMHFVRLEQFGEDMLLVARRLPGAEGY